MTQLKSVAYEIPRLLADGPDELLVNLVHDLRQPLSAIEAIAFYLDLRLESDQTEARRYVAHLQELVAEANTCLSAAVVARRKPCAELAVAGS